MTDLIPDDPPTPITDQQRQMLDRLEYKPLAELAATPTRDGPVDVHTDRWWVSTVVDGETMLAFYRPPGSRRGWSAPQCNSNQRFVTDMIRDGYPGHEPLHVPIVYLPHRCEDYR